MLAGWFLFMVGIAMAAIMNDGIGLYTLAKYFAFLLIIASLLFIPQLSPALLEKSLSVALIISLIPLILLALFRQFNMLVILGDGRMGWLASWPGVLWKIGAFVWPFAVWRCLKKLRLGNLLLALGSALTMAMDGSRTSMLWLVLVWVTLTIIVLATKSHQKPLRSHITLLLVTLLSFFVIQPGLLSWVSGHYDPLISEFKEWQELPREHGNKSDSDSDVYNFMKKLGKDLTTGDYTADRLITGDNSTRLDMLRIGWEKAVDKFPWGGGFDSTQVTDFDTTSVIHLTYLQLLADDGVFSFAGYLLFMLFPLYSGLRFVTEKRQLFVERFERLLCPLSVLIMFLFMGFFHPLSNELTEWGIVLAAMTIVITHVPRRN
ncbi:hypothetical protein C9426_17970 [Serratia sp. S1B]|nr:hypothetical protein C9426_17970 [Serratia sp. S1B]